MKFSKNPKFLDDRVGIWNELFDKQKKVYDGKFNLILQCFQFLTIFFLIGLEFPREEIKVTLPDGTVKT